MLRRSLGPTLTAAVVALGLASQASWPAWAEQGEFDVPDSVVLPAVLFELRQLQEDEPDTTLFKVDRASLTFPAWSGNLNRVAEYMDLQSGVYLNNLYFAKVLNSGILTVEGTIAGTNNRRVGAGYKDPGSLEVQITDTKVLHRLEHNKPGVDIDFNPNDVYQKTWERVRADVNVGISKSNPQVSIIGSFENQTRKGDQQHTFFQLHRFNCTDCHTFSTSQGISQSTDTYTVGAQASLGNRTHLYGVFGGSRYSDSGSIINYNFGDRFGTMLTQQNSTRDTFSNFMAYTGDEKYRAGFNTYNLSRTSDTTGFTFQGNYLTASAAYQPMSELLVTANYYSEDQTNSYSSNLSTTRRNFYVEANGYPTRWLTMRLRLGQDDSTYNLGAGPLLSSPANTANHDRYIDARIDVRPDKDIRFGARYRNDAINQPFFTVDPANRDLFEAWVTWSPSPVVVGYNYHKVGTSNNQYATSEETSSAYINALVNENLNMFATYSVTDQSQNSMYPVLLADPLTTPRQLQIGYPYTAHLSVFSAGVDVGLGTVRARPYFRHMDSRSQGLFLPGTSPSFTDDTRLSLSQDAFGLHFDLPAWDGTSLGVGWEYQNWNDLLRAINNGTVNFYTIDFRTRF